MYRYIEQTSMNVFDGVSPTSNVIWFYYIAGKSGTMAIIGYEVSEFTYSTHTLA